MAVRHDMGKVAAAIEAGKWAASNIDSGPIETSTITDNKVYYGDFQFEDVNNNVFLFGFHKWGDNVNKVYK